MSWLRRSATALLVPALVFGIARLHSRQAADRYQSLSFDGRFVGSDSKNRLVDFESRFEVPPNLPGATLRVAASPAAALALNGQPIYRGGLRDFARAIASVRIDAYLHPGSNDLSGTLQNLKGNAGILFEIVASDGRMLAASGHGTRFHEGQTIVRGRPRFAPWRKTKGWVSLLPLARLKRPEILATRDPLDESLYDFGSLRVGYPIIHGAPSGTKLFYGESREEALSQHPFAEEKAASLDRNGLGFVRRSCRFLRLSPGAATAAVSIIPVAFPAKAIGSFRCSDPILQQAYRISRQTILDCSQSFLEDGPKRDRAAWAADLLVEAPAALYLFGASGLVKRTLRLLASSRTPDLALPPAYPYPRSFTIPSYAASWIMVLDTYRQLSGDAKLVDDLLPVVKEQAAWLASYQRGSIAIAKGPIASWLSEPSVSRERSAFGRAIVLLGLESATRLLADRNGSRKHGIHNEQLLQSLKRSQDGLVDGRHDATVAACLIAPSPKQRHAFLDGVKRRLWTPAGPLLSTSSQRIAPFIGGLEAWARFRSEDSSGALQLIRNLYGRMTASGCAYEFVAASGAPYASSGTPFRTSLCHGWSAAPAWLLPAYVLGIRPAGDDGFRTFLVEPDLDRLAFAEGTVPTPLGPIEVSVRRNKEDFRVAVRCPATTTGRLRIHRLVPGSTIDTIIPKGGGVFGIAASDGVVSMSEAPDAEEALTPPQNPPVLTSANRTFRKNAPAAGSGPRIGLNAPGQTSTPSLPNR